MPPARMLTIPVTSRTHQPLLTWSIWARVHDPGRNGLLTIIVTPLVVRSLGCSRMLTAATAGVIT